MSIFLLRDTASFGEILRDPPPGLIDPEKRVEEDSREWWPTEEWEWGGDPIGLITGVDWDEALVRTPSCDGLWT